MSIRRRVGAAFVALGAVLVVLAMSVSPVNAEAPSKAGWWFELQGQLPAALPSPPVVPKDGLYVQQTPNGPAAYGAVHYDAKDIEGATLTLAAAQGSTTTLGAPLQACATSSSWETPSPQPGRWSDAPKYTSQCTPGSVSSDGKYVAFLFDASFVQNGAIDVAIVPKDGATPFAIAFDHPADDSLVLKAGLSKSTFSPPPTTTATGASSAVGAGSSVVAPSTAVAARPASPAVPAAPAAPAPIAASPPAVAKSALNLVGFGDPDRGARMAALSGASAIVIGWWLLSTRAVRMPQLLGALGGSGAAPIAATPDPTTRVAGVGRFAKTRTENPRRLR